MIPATAIVGAAAGIGVAFFQSISYLATRHYMHKGDGGNRRLLVLSHLWMGGISIALLPLFWPDVLPPVGRFIEPLLSSSLFYLIGQISLLMSLKWAEPSQVSPMLAFKLVVLGLLVQFVGAQRLNILQWTAIGLCVAGGVILHSSGSAGRGKAAICVAVTCCAYALSDWNLKRLLVVFEITNGWGERLVFPTLAGYAFTGAAALPFLPKAGSRRWGDWREAAPFGLAWLAAMLCLTTAFALIGLVPANILQSTRGLMSVVMGSLLSAMGFLHLEKKASPAVFARRALAAVLMMGAIALYAFGSR